MCSLENEGARAVQVASMEYASSNENIRAFKLVLSCKTNRDTKVRQPRDLKAKLRQEKQVMTWGRRRNERHAATRRENNIPSEIHEENAFPEIPRPTKKHNIPPHNRSSDSTSIHANPRISPSNNLESSTSNHQAVRPQTQENLQLSSPLVFV